LIQIRGRYELVVDVKVDFTHQCLGPLAAVPRPLRPALLTVIDHKTSDRRKPKNSCAIAWPIEPENGLGLRGYRKQESQKNQRSSTSLVTHACPPLNRSSSAPNTILIIIYHSISAVNQKLKRLVLFFPKNRTFADNSCF
jgi:hypothetical protein